MEGRREETETAVLCEHLLKHLLHSGQLVRVPVVRISEIRLHSRVTATHTHTHRLERVSVTFASCLPAVRVHLRHLPGIQLQCPFMLPLCVSYLPRYQMEAD